MAQLPLSGMPKLPPFATINPRELRIIAALARTPAGLTREELDVIAGASNVPDAIMLLREKGLDIPSVREPVSDRDGETVYRGRYRFTDADYERTAHLWEGGDHA